MPILESSKHQQKKHSEYLTPAFVLFPALLLCIWPNRYLAWATIVILLIGIGNQIVKGLFKPSFNLVFLFIFFAASATFGYWAAYIPAQALTKLFVLTVAVLLALYLSNGTILQPLISTHLAIGSFLFATAFLAVLVLNISQGERLTPNRFAGHIAILAPFLVLAFLNSGSNLVRMIISGATLIVAAALLISGSRGGMASLIIGMFLWWVITNRSPFIKHRFSKSAVAVTLIGLACIGSFGLYIVDWLANSPIKIIPGSGSRLTLYSNLKHLLPDYWLLGGGLNNFGGHYSQYVLSIPHLRFTYGHNLYFDLILEQGAVGFISFCLIVITALVLLLKRSIGDEATPDKNFIGAILASLTTLILHGFIDDAIYGNTGSTLLFIAPALAFSLQNRQAAAGLVKKINLTTFIGLIILAALFSKKIISAWHSNLAAIDMAKVQLNDWPTGEWSRGEAFTELETLPPTFEKAIAIDEQNSAAFYRLGLIDMEKQDFETAAEYLIQAHTLNSDHIGINKNLGYALLWSGNSDEASVYLKNVEGVLNELDVYIWWWQSLDRPDLSNVAKSMRESGDLPADS